MRALGVARMQLGRRGWRRGRIQQVERGEVGLRARGLVGTRQELIYLLREMSGRTRV